MYSKDSITNPRFKKFRGYVCGKFKDAPIFSEKVEVALMDYDELKNHLNEKHFHKISDELGLILEGSLEMEADGDFLTLKKNDFIFQKTGTAAELKKITKDIALLVIKAPSAPGDKIKI